MSFNIEISDEVKKALQEKRPVVALESTLITHGLPYPHNVTTALDMEKAVRMSGSIPATIAIIKGVITVGLSKEAIEYLAKIPAGDVRKCSRRDLSISQALKEDASTTVAGTMIIAHKVGIKVFATGGIGGVHREAPHDVSADLLELGRTPVAVVCSGAKAILDLPLTAEVLETQGVPLIGYGVHELPGFYTRLSGIAVDATVNSPEAAANIIAASINLGSSQGGLIIGVPVPEAYALSHEVMNQAIDQAIGECSSQSIIGKAVTPFLLKRVSELTEGESRKANVALLINNALIAGQIAYALSLLQ
jgi:pseudouridine-5'-phosphate glycosidase